MKQLLSTLRSKRGYEIVEASVVIPLILVVTIVFLRLFTFYLEILTTSVQAHEAALDKTVSGSRRIGVYEESDIVEMLPSSILQISPYKEINTRAYYINEDLVVRGTDIIKDE